MKMLVRAGVALAFAAAPPAFGATLAHDYKLDGSLADSLGGASLTALRAPVQTATGVSISGGNGLQLAGSAFPDVASYSILMTLQVDSADGAFGYGGVFAPQAGGNGLYVFGSGTEKYLTYYYAGNQGLNPFTYGVVHDIALVRNASGAASLYVDGFATAIPFAQSIDASGFARFFNQPGENVSGFVDRIRIYEGALTSSEVSAAFTAATGVPEAACWAMMIVGFGGIGAAMRRRRVVPANA